jgi:hypothetical protein
MREPLLLALLAGLATAHPSEPQEHRLCPNNYTYAGDDGWWADAERGILTWTEVARSPVYSCYLIVTDPADFLAANQRCWNDKAQVLSLDDEYEAERFSSMAVKLLPDEIDGVHTPQQILTSGFNVDSSNNWMWFALNLAVPENMTQALDSAGSQCLTLDITSSATGDVKLATTQCGAKNAFACEARVVTVTYAGWFMANWFSFLLVFFIFLLLLGLCTSCTTSAHIRAVRRMHSNTQSHRPSQMDLPPSYETTCTNQANDATGTLEKYKQKGKELVAKVVVYGRNK